MTNPQTAVIDVAAHALALSDARSKSVEVLSALILRLGFDVGDDYGDCYVSVVHCGQRQLSLLLTSEGITAITGKCGPHWQATTERLQRDGWIDDLRAFVEAVCYRPLDIS